MSKLVIVESPAKAKTIQKYLGKGYDVIASMGHVRDLPENRLSVDVKKHFQPKYTVIKGKEKLVEELEKMADKSEAVFLATDPDREWGSHFLAFGLSAKAGPGGSKPRDL